MIYTLAKFFIWGLGFALIGAIVGWLLRSVRADSDDSNLALAASVDDAETERLRHRVATLEVVAAERDRLAAQLASCQDDVAKAKAVAKEANVALDDALRSPSTLAAPTLVAPTVAPVPASAPAPAPTAAPFASSGEEMPAPAPVASSAPVSAPPAAPPAFAGLARADLDAARAVFGRAVKMDDLELIEGIGPKIAELLTSAGILTWSDLAHSQIGAIRTILEGAGERFRMHDPTTWPRQAGLAARGRWEELKSLQDALDGGRE
ncbi:MAG: hypothetical protein AB7V43_23010 [Acidimicrobiia bacterium]